MTSPPVTRHHGVSQPKLVLLVLAGLFAGNGVAGALSASQDQAGMHVGTVWADWTWSAKGTASRNDVEAPVLTSMFMPDFSPATRRARPGTLGHVVVGATIDEEGRVVDAKLDCSSAAGISDEAVLPAVRQWRFRPATSAGSPVAVNGIFTLRYDVSDAAAAPSDAAPAASRDDAAGAAAGRDDAVRMGSGELVAPVQLTQVLPEYTPEAKRDGVEGDVYMEGVVTTEGTIADPKIIRGLQGLSCRALDALSQWTFAPGTRDGEPVDVVALFTVTFRIR